MKADVEALAQQIADGAWAELGPKIETLKADWDSHRRQLQARNTELVERCRGLEAALRLILRWEDQATPHGGLASDMKFARVVLDPAPVTPSMAPACKRCLGTRREPGTNPAHGVRCPECAPTAARATVAP